MITKNQQEILNFLKVNQAKSSKEIADFVAKSMSYATVKRMLALLVAEGFLTQIGDGKARKYDLSKKHLLLAPINLDSYFAREIDERNAHSGYNFALLEDILPEISLFTNEEFAGLNELQHRFKQNISELSAAQSAKEMERLAIDLSWKSSQIEGNTYSLLETERLLKERITADGKTKEDAEMLLNHKEAIDFIVKTPDYVQPLSVAVIEDIHSILIKNLGVDRNIRKRRVGISGTNYSPLDNEFQIREAMQKMCDLINSRNNIFEKALLALVLLSYIQPFNDGNKRTARIVSNALLISNQFCPISFRTVDSVEYKKAMLVFYELNNIQPLKEIFIGQFAFAVNTYF